MGDIGAVAKLLNTLASWFLSEDGYIEFQFNRHVKKVESDAIEAIQTRDYATADKHIAALKRLLQEP